MDYALGMATEEYGFAFCILSAFQGLNSATQADLEPSFVSGMNMFYRRNGLPTVESLCENSLHLLLDFRVNRLDADAAN